MPIDNIEIGKAYKTRSGFKVIITHIIEGAEYSHKVIGYVEGFATDIKCWLVTGRVSRTNTNSPFDLMDEWIEPVSKHIFINVFEGNVLGSICNTLEQALAFNGVIKTLHQVINVSEGSIIRSTWLFPNRRPVTDGEIIETEDERDVLLN